MQNPATDKIMRVSERAVASLQDATAVLQRLVQDDRHVAVLEQVVECVADAFRSGHKVLACGNGGSACDAMHFCEELTARFRGNRQALPAMACSDAGFITCAGNDFGYERVFERWVEAFGQKGDVLVVLTTSGTSINVLRAVKAAQKRGMRTVAMLGRDGGDLGGVCDHEWIVPGETSDRIQELHMLLLHIVVECIEVKMGLA
ncbi:MAG: SIS domain-containing protein [Phycisphaerales bacterium]|nr:SIS domain-containing protein [Phycisphaerales bacterium]